VTASAALGKAPRLLLLERDDARFRVALFARLALFRPDDRDAELDLRPPARFPAPAFRAVVLRDELLFREELLRFRAEPPRFLAEPARFLAEPPRDELLRALPFDPLRDPREPREAAPDLRAPPLRPPARPRVFRPPALELFLPPLEPLRDDFLAAAMISAPIKKCQHRRQRHRL
jgi:hypothetical protein